jgi:hypothetical protein
MPNFFDDLSPPKTETDPWSEAGFWLLGRAVEAAKPNSSTYQALVAEGRSKGHIEGTRAIILRMGTKRFGPPDAETQAVLAAATISGTCPRNQRPTAGRKQLERIDGVTCQSFPKTIRLPDTAHVMRGTGVVTLTNPRILRDTISPCKRAN